MKRMFEIRLLNPKAALIIISVSLFIFSCRNGGNGEGEGKERNCNAEFFGDSALVILSSNRPNGYNVKLFQTKGLSFLNLSRADSLNIYIELDDVPFNLLFPGLNKGIEENKPGTFYREMLIPRVRELNEGVFFMDVNFDGKDELVVSHLGYNRLYYSCYDLSKGSDEISHGTLQPMGEPFNQFIGGEQGETKFDWEKKTIHILEGLGCCAYQETWCEEVADFEGDNPSLQTVRKVYAETSKEADGEIYKTTVTYKREEGSLKEVEKVKKKL